MPEFAETFFARDRAAWRAWLAAHHADRRELWLLLAKKHTGEASATYDEAVEEALCFGWIDGKTARYDDRRQAIRFTPRKPKSMWSETNKARVKKLVAEGRMTEAGLALVAAAKASGEWQRAAERERTDVVPDDLAAALARNRKAHDAFAAFAPGYRKLYIAWVQDAKRPETRQRRVRTVVERSAAGRKPGIDL